VRVEYRKYTLVFQNQLQKKATPFGVAFTRHHGNKRLILWGFHQAMDSTSIIA